MRKNEFSDIFNRIRKRNFKGNTGLAIKNSIYDFFTNVVEKIGALIFIVILARILMPELFGLYSIALSTILIFVSFSDLGIGQTLIRFVSKESNKNKAKSYIIYLVKLKFILLSIIMIILVVSARFISNNYYQKPIFLALLAGVLYILLIGAISFIQSFFQSQNNFRVLLYKQIFFQILRIIIVPVLVMYSLYHFASNNINIFVVIFSLCIVWFLALLFLLIFAKKTSLLKIRAGKLQKKEKKKINKFILSLSLLSLSGLFFGYIDIIMLGRFVLSEFIGYYNAAFTLISSFAPLIIFSSVLLPIFSKMKGKKLEESFYKSLQITFILSVSMFILVFVFAPTLINIIYGRMYSYSIVLLRLLSFLILSLPSIFLYTSYFIAKGKTKIVVKLLIVSILINITLNYLFINILIHHSQLLTVIGVCVATLISKFVYLSGLVLSRKK